MKCRKCDTDRKVEREVKVERGRTLFTSGRRYTYFRNVGTCPKCKSIRKTTWECDSWESPSFTSASQPYG